MHAAAGLGKPGEDDPRGIGVLYVLYVAAGAVWPRVVYFKTRLRGRGLAVHAGWVMFWWFAAFQWLRPYARRKQAEHAAAENELRTELGREPTQVEVMERLGYSMP